MSEPDLVGSFSTEEKQSSQSEVVLEDSTLSRAPVQTLEGFGQPSTAGLEQYPHLWEQQYQALLGELAQAQRLCQKRLERIYQLEQALDQSLASMQELRSQLVDQRLMEAQLASTEEISNIQQQAIAQLKLQLTQQQQVLEVQLQETQLREQTFQELLTATEALTQAQQLELERLRNQIAHDWAEGQSHQTRLEKQLTNLQSALGSQQQRVTELEAQVLSARTIAASLEVQLDEAQGQIDTLSKDLSDRQTALTRLETELKQAYTALEEQQSIIMRLQQPQPSTPSTDHAATVVALNRDLAIAHAKVEEFAHSQSRLTELEQQTAEMQEQILKQAQQASEYEAAVQHWKDRCLASQSYALRLKDLLTPLLVERAIGNQNAGASVPHEAEALLEELVKTLQSPAMNIGLSAKPATIPPPDKPAKVDLPDFLAKRRRNYRAQS